VTSACLRDESPFGVCLITAGNEVMPPGKAKAAPAFASVGTLARITHCDAPQLGILHLRTLGGSRFEVRSHKLRSDGLVVGEIHPLADEPDVPIPDRRHELRR